MSDTASGELTVVRSRDAAAVVERAAALAHPLFVHHNWKYEWNNPHVPTADDLRRCIAGLIERLGDEPGAMRCSGRFQVERTFEGIEVHLHLGTVHIDGAQP